MGSCNNCHKKIMYNKYKRYRKEILCLECYNTRLERKAAKKAELKKLADLNKIVTPKKKAKKKAKSLGLTLNAIDDVTEHEKKSANTAEDSR